MFQRLWRRGRQGRKSVLAPAVIPVVEALDKRQLLSGDVTLAVEVLTADDHQSPPPVLYTPGDRVIFPFWIPDDYQGWKPVNGSPPVITEPMPVVQPPPVVPEIPPAPRGIVFRDTGLDFLPVGADIYGTDGDDNIVITYDAAADGIRVSGVAGIEDGTLFTGISMLTVHAGAGNDTVMLDCGPRILGWMHGDDGDDLLVATGRVLGLAGDAGNDTLRGSEDNEQFYGGPGNDSIDGGGGYDCLNYEADLSFGVVADLANGIIHNDGYGSVDTAANIEVDNGPLVPFNRNVRLPEDAGKATGGLVIRHDHMYIYGTDEDDVITIVSGPGKNQVQVTGVRGVPDGMVFIGINYVDVEAGAGDDVVTLDWGDTARGWIVGGVDGEAGNDTLRAINGTDACLKGGTGDDTYLLPLVYSPTYIVDSEGQSTIETYDFTDGALPRSGPVMQSSWGMVTIFGTPGDDNLRIVAGSVPGEIRIYGVRGIEDGTSIFNVNSIAVDMGDGNDTVVIDLTAAPGPFLIEGRGGTGTDSLQIMGSNGTLARLTDVEQYSGPTDGASMAALTTPRATAAAKRTPAQARKQKLLLAKQRKAKLLKLKQAKLAAKKAELAQKRAELAERRAEARRQDN